MKYNPSGSAAEIYLALQPIRDNFLRRAEDAAALTIPMLVPRNSNQRIGSIQSFPTPRQSIGARGVNHLSSRLLLTLLPPSAPFFKYLIDPFALDILTQQDPSTQAGVKATLSQVEQSVHQVVETEAMRVGAAEIFKHLIVAGNALMSFPKSGGIKFYPLSQYVAMRDQEGNKIIEMVLCECVDEAALPADVREIYEASSKDQPEEPEDGSPNVNTMGGSEDCVELYTRMYLMDNGMYHVHQEFKNGIAIPETEGTYKEDDMPFHVLRWAAVPGEAYGRGLVEEYKGYLESLEGLAQALVEGSLASARVVGLIRPNSNTRAKDINDAQNGEFIYGVEDDVKFLTVDKQMDFRVAMETGASIQKALEQAFLLNSSVTRDAERVTAEEIRYVAQELETSLGGVFTILAHEFQLPLVKSILARLTKKKAIPPFPKNLQDFIKPVIVTGIDALGRNEELERLRAGFQVIQGIIGPEATAAAVHSTELATYIFSQVGVTIKGIVKTKEEVAQEQQQQQNAEAIQNMVKQGTGPMIKAKADQMMNQQQQGVQQ